MSLSIIARVLNLSSLQRLQWQWYKSKMLKGHCWNTHKRILTFRAKGLCLSDKGLRTCDKGLRLSDKGLRICDKRTSSPRQGSFVSLTKGASSLWQKGLLETLEYFCRRPNFQHTQHKQHFSVTVIVYHGYIYICIGSYNVYLNDTQIS